MGARDEDGLSLDVVFISSAHGSTPFLRGDFIKSVNDALRRICQRWSESRQVVGRQGKNNPLLELGRLPTDVELQGLTDGKPKVGSRDHLWRQVVAWENFVKRPTD